MNLFFPQQQSEHGIKNTLSQPEFDSLLPIPFSMLLTTNLLLLPMNKCYNYFLKLTSFLQENDQSRSDWWFNYSYCLSSKILSSLTSLRSALFLLNDFLNCVHWEFQNSVMRPSNEIYGQLYGESKWGTQWILHFNKWIAIDSYKQKSEDRLVSGEKKNERAPNVGLQLHCATLLSLWIFDPNQRNYFKLYIWTSITL